MKKRIRQIISDCILGFVFILLVYVPVFFFYITPMRTEQADDTAEEERYLYSENENKGSGIRSFIEQTMMCEICGQAMTLEITKNKSPYLHCKSCDNMDVLGEKEVDNYIFEEKISCPDCGARIKAKRKRGKVVVECQNGHIINAADL